MAAAPTDDAPASLYDSYLQFPTRVDCYNAYDRALADEEDHVALTPAVENWMEAFEDNALDGQPCPMPLPEQVARGGAWVVQSHEAEKLILKYARRNRDPVALTELGLYWTTGHSDAYQPDEGWSALEEAAKAGVPAAISALSLRTGDPRYVAQAFDQPKAAAELGDPAAMFRLGQAYRDGGGTRADAKAALGWFRKSAESGNWRATLAASEMLSGGMGVKKDMDEALRLARVVAKGGHAEGAYMVAALMLQMPHPETREGEIRYWVDLANANASPSLKGQMSLFTGQVDGVFEKYHAAQAARDRQQAERDAAVSTYVPRQRQACPTKTVCLVDRFTGVQNCTTHTDYWNGC
ncbi:MAG: sel1 repeat family protein [Sphingomonadales bacterium]|nr:sel1 repeat family protein [Sphingomonadales bacterium]